MSRARRPGADKASFRADLARGRRLADRLGLRGGRIVPGGDEHFYEPDVRALLWDPRPDGSARAGTRGAAWMVDALPDQPGELLELVVLYAPHVAPAEEAP